MEANTFNQKDLGMKKKKNPTTIYNFKCEWIKYTKIKTPEVLELEDRLLQHSPWEEDKKK